MTNEELAVALKELTAEVARLSLRVTELENELDPPWAEQAKAANRAEREGVAPNEQR